MNNQQKKKISSSFFSEEKPADLSFFVAQEAAAVLKFFQSRKTGLRETEIRRRLTYYGYNILVKEVKFHTVKEFLSKFKSPLVIY